tara:strand:+ start:90 stop:554 length:465 start_codon:yes stop_codon:yes gene_type:complete
MELSKIISRAKQMQKTMKADKIDNVALEAMLKEVVKCKDELQAQNFWSSIRAYCKTIPNSPFTVNRSNLPIEVQEVMATIKAEVIEASTTFFNTGNISRVLTKHGKSGGGLFANAEEYATMMANMTYGKLRQQYNAKSWDGTLEGLPTVEEAVE